MSRLLFSFAMVSLLLAGGIFGFFYAWVCSTMWGLDAMDPRGAMAAMQAMNGSVRNAVFAPAFFGTPFVLFATAVLALMQGLRQAGWTFLAGGVVYFAGGMMLTMMVNVPMNEALGALAVPDDIEEARVIWQEYSGRWQVFNQIRAVLSGVTLLLTGWGMFLMARANPTQM